MAACKMQSRPRTRIITSLSLATKSTHHSKHPIIVLIAFGGFRPSYIKGNILEKFKSEASSVEYLRNVFPTQTFPNLQSIATGMYPDMHGVLSDWVFDESHNTCLHHSSPQVYSYNPKIITPIWVLNEKGGDGRYSGVMMWPGSNHLYQGTLSTFVVNINKQMTWEERMDTAVGWLIHEKTPANLVLMYFEEPDATAHKYGPKSEEVRAQLARVNNIMLYYVRQLRDHDIMKEVNTIILSDHGMTSVKQDKFVDLNDYVSPQAYKLCGRSPILQIEPTKGAEAAVYDGLFKGASVPENYFNVYKREEIPDKWHIKENPRVPAILVVCRSGYVFNDVKDLRGQHGYDFGTSMYGFFMARGPLFKPGYSYWNASAVQNIDIYPLIAKILNLELSVKPNGSSDYIQNILINQANETEEINLFS